MTVAAEKGDLAEDGSPVDVPFDRIDTRSPLRWISVTLLVATLFLAITNARDAVDWLNDGDTTALKERLRPAIEGWAKIASSTRLDRPGALLHRYWQDLRGDG